MKVELIDSARPIQPQESFVFYASFLDAIDLLDDEQSELQVYRAIANYGLRGKETPMNKTARMLFTLIRPQLYANNQKRAAGAKGKEYGKLGGKPPGSKTPMGLEEETPMGLEMKTPNVNVNANENGNANVNVNAIEQSEREKARSKKNIADFSLFWDAYPKKQAKKDAQKAWDKINPDETLLQSILSAVEAWKNTRSWQQEGGQYIPLAATWLNGRRWEDEAPTASSGNIFLDMLKNERATVQEREVFPF